MADFEQIAQDTDSFEAFVYKVVEEDLAEAKRFIGDYHRQCDQIMHEYTAALRFESIRSQNRFPMPIIQRDIDTFVADAMERIWYFNRPVRIVPAADTTPEEADLKQELLEYQNMKDNVRRKFRKALTYAGLFRLAVVVNDWSEQRETRWRERQDPVLATDESGMPVMDEEGNPMAMADEQGQPLMYPPRWVPEDVVVYEGPEARVIDPRDVFFGPDKEDADDRFPIMFRSFLGDHDFDKPYMFNQDQVRALEKGEKAGATDAPVRHIGDRERTTRTDARPHEYIEWQGMLPKGRLYQWLVTEKRREDLVEVTAQKRYMLVERDADGNEYRSLVDIDEHDLVQATVGIISGRDLVVRCEENSFGTDGSNVVIGVMGSEEEGLLSMGLADRIVAVQKAMNDLAGMLVTAFKASINRGSVVDESKILNPDEVELNKPGWCAKTNGDVDKVLRFYEPPDVADGVLRFMSVVERYGQDAGGMRSAILGTGDPAAETLGEFTDTKNQAVKRVAQYMQAFEDSFVVPFFRKRNQMNCALIDTDYAIRVLGEQGAEWKQISPETIRADVDYVCEASTRETNRAVLAQQLLQAIQVSGAIVSAGQPVRLDKLLAKLCRHGWAWNEEEIEDFLPLLKIAQGRGDAFDKLLAENALMAQAMQRVQSMMSSGMMSQERTGGGGGGELPQPRSESEAIESANQANRPQVRTVE